MQRLREGHEKVQREGRNGPGEGPKHVLIDTAEVLLDLPQVGDPNHLHFPTVGVISLVTSKGFFNFSRA